MLTAAVDEKEDIREAATLKSAEHAADPDDTERMQRERGCRGGSSTRQYWYLQGAVHRRLLGHAGFSENTTN